MPTRWFSFALFAFPLIWVLHPLWIPIAMAGVFAVTLHPVLERLERRKFPSWVAALVLSVGTFLLVLVPLGFLAYTGAARGFEFLSQFRIGEGPVGPSAPEGGAGFEAWMQGWLSASPVAPLFEKVTHWLPVTFAELTSWVAKAAGALALFLGGQARKLLTGLPSFGLSLTILVLCLFIFLLEGKRVIWFLMRRLPFAGAFTERLFTTARLLCRAVIVAMVLSGLAQAAFYGLVCLFAGAGDAALIALLVFLASLIPVVGSAPLTFGIAAYFLLSGSFGVGLTLTIAAAITASLDNFVRPWVLSGEGKLHPVTAFLAAIGGLQTIGVAGIFLGPIIVGICLEALSSLPSEI